MKNAFLVLLFITASIPKFFSNENVELPVLSHTSSVTNALCFQQCDGIIEITSVGGTAPLQYSIDNGVTFSSSNIFNGLCSGTYNVIVEDGTFTQSTSSETVGEPTLLNSTVFMFNDVTCNSLCDGDANVNVSGGTVATNYGYIWSDGQTTQQALGLCAGTYIVTVNDDNNCTTQSSVTISEPAPLTITMGLANPACNNSCDGMINSIPAGGDGNYTYSWSNGATFPTVSNVCAGTYTLTITDGNGCFVDTIITLSAPQSAVITNITETNESCPGTCDGSIEIVASNVSQYSIDGVNFSSSPIFTSLCAGTYTAYVQDVNACSASVLAQISSPTSLGVSATSDSPICIGESSLLTGSASGGTLPYTYSWADNSGSVILTTQNGNVSPVTDALYTLTVTDANGCDAANATLVQVNDPLNVMVFGDSPICSGLSSDISSIASGGNGGPYTYTWDQGIGVGQNQTVSPTQTTVYTVTVADGCSTPLVSAQVTINVNSVPLFGGTVSDEMFGNDGAIDLYSVPAGSSFDWDNDGVGDFDDPEDLTGLVAGTYSVSLMTPEGCLGTATFSVESQVGLEELLNSGDLRIHPNPNNGSFSIDLGNTPGIKSIRILDINGRVTFQKENAFSSAEKVELPRATTGFYFLTVETEGGNYRKKIIVIR